MGEAIPHHTVSVLSGGIIDNRDTTLSMVESTTYLGRHATCTHVNMPAILGGGHEGSTGVYNTGLFE